VIDIVHATPIPKMMIRAHATPIPKMMIHTTLKSAQAVETKDVKPLKGENYTPKVCP
jgi:hypothetical protein